MDEAFKPKCGPRDQEDVAELARRFAGEASEALASGDPNELFNAAVEFALEHGIASADMGRVLAVVRRWDPTIPARVIRTWLLEGRGALREVRNDASNDELAGQQLRLHGEQTSWAFKDWIAELNRWQEIFNQELFEAALPMAVVSIDWARFENLGTYRIGRDGLALKHRINLNSRHVRESASQTLGVLLHEQVHLWEDVVHQRRRGGSYHTRRFRDKVASFGIPTDQNGHFLGVEPDGRFARLLARHGVNVSEAAPEPEAGRGKPRSRLAKWVCGCRIIRVARGVGAEEIKCLRCGKDFTQAD